jgi:hypothetical protein
MFQAVFGGTAAPPDCPGSASFRSGPTCFSPRDTKEKQTSVDVSRRGLILWGLKQRGLLHDIGYIVNLVLAPQQMKAALEQGTGNHIFIGEVEHSALGFTHCQSGEVLAHK